MICDKCDGRGSFTVNHELGRLCPKCQGAGKVDWIENIVGKKPKPFMGSSSYATWSTGMSSSGTGISPSFTIIDDVILNECSKKIAEQIDKEILECYMNEWEQNKKRMKAASSVFKQMEEHFDNRIIS